MKKWLRRLRGAVGIGLTWAVAWALLGPLLFSLVLLLMPGGSLAGVNLLLVVGQLALTGFVGGAAFSVLLGVIEGRRTFSELSLPRFAGWGALAGILIYVGAVVLSGVTARLHGEGFFVLGMSTASALLGAGSAAGSLALARNSGDRELLEDAPDVADPRLTENEGHQLPGPTG